MRTFVAADGVPWTVEGTLPGASNVMVVFHHPDGRTARKDRYNWYYVDSSAARNVMARLDAAAVVGALTDAQLALLFRRSMLISAADNPLNIPIATPA